MHLFQYRKNRLHCEGVDLVNLSSHYGTPAYIYSGTTIQDHYRRLTAALAPLDHGICYAVKANSNIAILQLLAELGSGFDIVSKGELFRVIQAGGNPQLCTFAGVCKTEEELTYALRKGIRSFNIESEPELDRLNRVAMALRKTAPVAIRVNPDVAADTHKYISTGKSENKFGVPLEAAEALYARGAGMKGVRLVGVQMHIGSQILKPEPFARAIRKMAPFVSDLKAKYDISFFSIGGGVGIIYDGAMESGQPDWWRSSKSKGLTLQKYSEAILPSLSRLGLKILLEPGRLLVGNAGALIARVHYIKRTKNKTFVIVDAGMNDLIRPALYEGYHEIVPLLKRPRSRIAPVDVVGPVCESGDFFAQNRPLPELRQDDLIAILSAGAYGAVMGSNYNSRPLPPELLILGARAHLVRKRQTERDLTRGEQLLT